MTDTLGVPEGIAAAVRRALDAPARLGRTRLIAVDGPSGSGKTSLARPLAEATAQAIEGTVIVPDRLSADDEALHLPRPAGQHRHDRAPGERDDALHLPRPAGQRHGDGAGRFVTVVSTDLLATWEHPLDWWPIVDNDLLAPLAAGRTARMPVVDWVSGNPRPGGAIVVPVVDVLILEGVSAGRRAAADRISALVWVEVPTAEARLERAVSRDGEAMRPYLVRWQAQEEQHFTADGTRRRADVVIRPASDSR